MIHCNHIHSMATLSTSIDRDSFYYNLSYDNCRWNSRNLLIWFVSIDKLILVEACIYPHSFPLELFNSSLFLKVNNREKWNQYCIVHGEEHWSSIVQHVERKLLQHLANITSSVQRIYLFKHQYLNCHSDCWGTLIHYVLYVDILKNKRLKETKIQHISKGQLSFF